MISTSSCEMSRQKRSSQRSSNQWLSLLSGVLFDDVDVELALVGQAGKGQVAAAQIADDGRDFVIPEEQIELGMEGVAKKELDDDFTGSQLLARRRRATSSWAVGIPIVN